MEGLHFFNLSQEHGQIRGETDLDVGARVRILPNHSCLAAAQFDRYFVVRGDEAVPSTPGFAAEATEVVLGPADGHDLPGTDLDRVAAGDIAPDFSARALGGDVHTLSDYRGEKNVILFFYRGHW